MKVLVAEDDHHMLAAIVEILEGEGYEVVSARDGLAIARDLADRNQAELRLVDSDEGACFELAFAEFRRSSNDA